MERKTGWRGLALAARITLRGGILVGWVCVGLFVLAFVAEAVGLPERWLQRTLRDRLGPAAEQLRVRSVDIAWTSRSMTVRGVSLGDGRDLTVDHLRLRLGWRADTGLRLERAEVRRGHVRLSRDLITALQDMVEERPDEAPPELPELVVHDLAIAVETPEYGDIDVGVLDAAVERGPGGRPAVSGRLIPALTEGGDTGEVFLDGRMQEAGVLEVRGAARDLPLTTAFLPEGEPFDPLRELAPLALFDLEATATWELGKDVLPTAEGRVRLAGGSLALPWLEAAETRRVRDVDLALEVAFDPGEPLALWDRDAWLAVGRADARWEGIDVEATVRIGRAATDGQLAEAWLHVPELPLDERALELGARRGWLVDLWEALRPAGEVEVAYGLAFPRGWKPEDGVRDATDRTVAILTGNTSAEYVGWPGSNSTTRDQGFPLRFEDVTARIFYLHRSGRELAEELVIPDLRGRHGADDLHARCSGWFVPAWRRAPEERDRGPRRFHLLATSSGITADDDLRDALAGLEGLPGCERLWDDYRPTDGRLGVRLELFKDERRPFMASDVRIDFQRCDARWSGFPVACQAIDGDLHLRGEGLGPEGRSVTSLSLRGRSTVARGPITVEGRAEFGPGGPDAARWEVRAQEVDLASTHLREELGFRDPRTLAGLEGAGVSGLADLLVVAARAHPGAPERRWIETTSASDGVRLLPEAFPMALGMAHGRALASWTGGDDADVESRSDLHLGVLGQWVGPSGPVPVWIGGRFPGDEPGRVEAFGAGLDPLAARLIEALEAGLSRRSDEPVEIDLSSIDVQGRFDFGAELVQDPTSGELEVGDVSLQARLRLLGFEELELLKNLRGRITWNRAEDVWRGPLLRAELGRTPVSLRDVTFRELPQGGWTLDAELVARGLPIDREHLRFFLDARTIRTLLEDFGARGRFDVESGSLHLAGDALGETSLRFQGRMRVRDLVARIGLPIEVRSAEEIDLDLRIEGGRVRALARVQRLFGKVAGRRLDDAHLQLTYIEPRLTIEALDGEFEGGRLRSLGGRGGSTFFAVDLEPPFPFVLAGRMHLVDVGQLLRGVFNSDFANRGRLGATLRLQGDLEHLTGIVGGGEFDLVDSSLWAVPVFQAVFSRLGLETTAVFSRMEGSYELRDGVVGFPDLRLESDLLSLVGAGTIDFDGTLVHDLEVRYALLDQFGPLTRLLYWVQNSLLRIAVRGDMSRPEVVVKGLFSQFFSAPSERQRLPLPGYGELPTRF